MPTADTRRLRAGRRALRLARICRTAGQLLVATVAGVATVHGARPSSDAATLVFCSGRLARVARHVAQVRERVVSRCALESLGCADSACSDGVATRCRSRLERLATIAARADHAARRCAARLGDELVDEEGLAYAALARYCAGIPVGDAGAALVCQRRALDCTADRAVAVLTPRGTQALAAMGLFPADPAGCIASRVCGDGVLDDDEECDDGAMSSDVLPDRCRTSCREPDCGDGVVDAEEECDDANAIDGDGCDADCAREDDGCGNGVLEADEECDDGNAVPTDGCDECTLAAASVCGDGIATDDEECDDGAANSDVLPDRCRTTCRLPSCGDGVVDSEGGEDCDPPGTLLCTGDCETRIALPGGATWRAARATVDPLEHCARGILRTGLHVLRGVRTAVGGCVRAAARCVLGDVASDQCLATAADRCRRAERRSDHVRAAARRSGARACAPGGTPLPLATLLAADGLGFHDVAARCPFGEPRPPSTSDLLACLTERAVCFGERSIAQATPRAYDLLSEVVDDPDAEFPCVPDPYDWTASPSGAFVKP